MNIDVPPAYVFAKESPYNFDPPPPPPPPAHFRMDVHRADHHDEAPVPLSDCETGLLIISAFLVSMLCAQICPGPPPCV